MIGGTQESAQLATAIAQAQLDCTVSVTTEAAKALYPPAPRLQVVVEKFSFDPLLEFLQAHRIVRILDASHPYAVEISRLAISAATHLRIPYLRFERPALVLTTGPGRNPVLDFEMLLQGDYLANQRVLLTIGHKPLPLFKVWQDRATLFARILPSVVALEVALEAGFGPERLVALRPPVPREIERAFWQHWQISLVVTKASGQPGGEDTKRAVATELGIPLVVIARPELSYPQQTSDLSTALAFCRQLA